jgi:organic hydroperoxide reductase OsmC/OhrA
MAKEHKFKASLVWTGAAAGPAETYQSYSREWTFTQEGREDLVGTAAVPYRGDPALRNPEDLLLASVSACHCLSYLAEAALAGVTVVDYNDECEALMTVKDGKMRITEIILRPLVTISSGSIEAADALHEKAHDVCFIANSVNFEILVEPETELAPTSA